MNSRVSVPATVTISMSRSYNHNTREFSANLEFTALQALSGQFNFNVILVEDGIVWPQSGSLGGPNYVHDWTVRAMMNGALGEQIVNGTWNQGQVFNAAVNYTYPVPPAPAPDIVPDSCRVVVLVYKVGTPLNSNGTIQQAIQMDLLSPDYVATMMSTSPDLIASNTTIANYQAVIHNIGLMPDRYGIGITLDAPVGWSAEFTTTTGTFPAGQIDSVTVNPGDSTVITVALNPNSVDGNGEVILNFVSAHNPGATDDILFRFATETGFSALVIDATEHSYEDVLMTTLDKTTLSGQYGVVSRTALHAAGVNISNFEVIFWSAANRLPAFYPEEVSVLQNFMDSGGHLFITGQDIGNDVMSGQSQHAQSFYSNYLHASFVSNASLFFLVNGYAGDPITNGLQFIVSDIYPRSIDIIAANDAQATPILKFMTGPNVGGIRASGNNYRVVYLSIGFEQIADEPDRDSILVRSIRWFNEVTTGIGDEPAPVYSFQLAQNYPNPFNPETTIKYSLEGTASQPTRLIVYNALGQVVRTLVDAPQTAGVYTVSWNGKDDFGNSVASGIYYCKLVSGRQTAIQKMILIR